MSLPVVNDRVERVISLATQPKAGSRTSAFNGAVACEHAAFPEGVAVCDSIADGAA